jgi:hypothetical protein
VVQSQSRQTVRETVSRKNPSQKRAGGVAQGVGPEFKLQYHKKKKKKKVLLPRCPKLLRGHRGPPFLMTVLALVLKKKGESIGLALPTPTGIQEFWLEVG